MILSPERKAALIAAIVEMHAEGKEHLACARALGINKNTAAALWWEHLRSIGDPRGSKPCHVPGCPNQCRIGRMCCTHRSARRQGRPFEKIKFVKSRSAVEKTCRIAGCGDPAKGNRLCSMHLQRSRKGSPDAASALRRRRSHRKGYRRVYIQVPKDGWRRLKIAAKARGLSAEEVAAEAIAAVCQCTTKRALERVIADELAWVQRAAAMEDAA